MLKRGDQAAADAYAAEAVEIAERVGGPLLLANALGARSECRRHHGDLLAAHADSVKALALLRQAGDRHNIAYQLGNLASLEIEAGNLQAARARLEEARQIASEIHVAAGVLAFILSNLGFAAILTGDFVAAADHCLASLTKARRAGDPLTVAYSLLGVAISASAQHEHELAVTLHGASSALFDSLGHKTDSIEADLQQHDLVALRTTLGTEFAPAYAAGRDLDLDAAVTLAQSVPPTAGRPAWLSAPRNRLSRFGR